ncbi:CotH kinase family protein [Candidatus Saccharibacteria bacterium]|nr:CotH kinase family protein [Candidatus Saccharibacteria bacterium]
MNSRRWWGVLWGSFLVAVILVVVIVLTIDGRTQTEEVAFIYDGIPRMDITLADITLEEIDNNEKVVKYDGNTVDLTSQSGVFQFDNVQISGHGNSTWIQTKKPYDLKFEKKVNLLGLGKAKKWVLLANALDDTQLRNDIAYYVGRMLGGDWAQNGEFVELYIDGDYRGLYYLVQKVEIGKDLVNLKDPLGVLVELDNLHTGGICYKAYDENCLVVKDLVDEENLAPAMRDFLDSFNALEIAAEAGDYETVEKLIDVESFAKYYLVSEFTSNPDAYNTSWHLYKDGVMDKIHAGVYWDYDLALSNARWGGSEFFLPEDVRTREKFAFGWKDYDKDGFEVELEVDKSTSRLIYYLMRMPEFRKVVDDIFAEKMCGRGEELLGWIEQRVAMIDEARQRDLSRWDKSDVNQESEKLINWVMRRFRHFENEYGNNCVNYDINVI